MRDLDHFVRSIANLPSQAIYQLHRRGYSRLATTTTCSIPRDQYDVALVDWPRYSARLTNNLVRNMLNDAY